MAEYITEYPHYFTATNLEWKRLLAKGKYKDIIIESMRFLVKDQRVIIYGFVIMDNHFPIIWHVQPHKWREAAQEGFLKYTGQQIKKDMLVNHPDELCWPTNIFSSFCSQSAFVRAENINEL